jgi:hypothetical protein
LLATSSEANFHDDAQNTLRSDKVRKDNTIAYKGNYYSAPTGTYQNQQSTVLLGIKDTHLIIYNAANTAILANHTISLLKGRLIRKTDHLRNKTSNLKVKQKQILDQLSNDQICQYFLKQIHQDKPRYYHDHLRVIKILLEKHEEQEVVNAIHQCVQSGIFNANELKQLLSQHIADKHLTIPTQGKPSILPEKAKAHPAKSSIDTYQSIMN